MKFVGTALILNERSKNNRTYSKEDFEKIDLTEDIFGELEHPTSASVNLERVSHKIIDINIKDNKVNVIAETMKTPMGMELENILRDDGEMFFSPRGLGEVDENGNVSNYELIAVDVITDNHSYDVGKVKVLND